MRMWANQLTASYTLSTRHLSAMRREEHSLRHSFLHALSALGLPSTLSNPATG